MRVLSFWRSSVSLLLPVFAMDHSPSSVNGLPGFTVMSELEFHQLSKNTKLAATKHESEMMNSDKVDENIAHLNVPIYTPDAALNTL